MFACASASDLTTCCMASPRSDTIQIWSGNVTFPYGVSSGDPYNNSVILQTIAEPYDLEGIYGDPTQCGVDPDEH